MCTKQIVRLGLKDNVNSSQNEETESVCGNGGCRQKIRVLRLFPDTQFAGMARTTIRRLSALGTPVPTVNAQNAAVAGKREQDAPPDQQKPT